MARMQLPWMAVVKVGDVLRSGSGTLRVVRYVSRFKDGELRTIGFAIRRCSWTHRPYTLYGYTDLKANGFTRIGANYSLSTELDKKIAAAIADHNDRSLNCCAVRGCA